MKDKIVKYCDLCDKDVETSVISKTEEYTIENETIAVDAKVRVCNECGNTIFDEELDQQTLVKAYSIYRQKHKLLTPEQIKNIREMYGLSQRAFAKLLNWGDRTINRYENGALQDKAHNALLVFLQDPRNMKDYILRNETGLDENKLKKLRERVETLINGSKPHGITICLLEILFNEEHSIFNGFKVFDYDKFCNAVLYFASKAINLLKVKLMKLLFYSDFVYFRENGVSLTGSVYLSLPFGPVPKEHDLLLESMRLDKLIEINKYLKDGYEYNEIVPLEPVSKDIFTQEEIDVLERVYTRFKDYGSKEIAEISHLEKGYIETKPCHEISYEYAKFIKIV